MKHPNKIYLVCALLVAALLILGACGGSAQRSRSGSSAARATMPTPAAGTLQCKDCSDAGINTANVFAGEDMNAVACRERWGTKVQILGTSTKDGVPIYRVKTPSCSGWVSSRLVAR